MSPEEDVGTFVLVVELLALDLSERYAEVGAPALVVGALACLATGARVARLVGEGNALHARQSAEHLRKMVTAPMIVLLALSEGVEPDGAEGDGLEAMLADAAEKALTWAEQVPRGSLQDRALILLASACALCIVVHRGDRERSATACGLVDENARHVAEKAAEPPVAAN